MPSGVHNNHVNCHLKWKKREKTLDSDADLLYNDEKVAEVRKIEIEGATRWIWIAESPAYYVPYKTTKDYPVDTITDAKRGAESFVRSHLSKFRAIQKKLAET